MDERTLGSDAARAVGRFKEDGPVGYVAATAPGAPVRATRAEAVEDERAWLERRSLFASLREEASRRGHFIAGDGDGAVRVPRWEDMSLLLDAVEAASEAAILSYDPSATTQQNDEYQRRARRLNEALGRLGIGPRAG